MQQAGPKLLQSTTEACFEDHQPILSHGSGLLGHCLACQTSRQACQWSTKRLTLLDFTFLQ